MNNTKYPFIYMVELTRNQRKATKASKIQSKQKPREWAYVNANFGAAPKAKGNTTHSETRKSTATQEAGDWALCFAN